MNFNGRPNNLLRQISFHSLCLRASVVHKS
jgi:hypothetical protein